MNCTDDEFDPALFAHEDWQAHFRATSPSFRRQSNDNKAFETKTAAINLSPTSNKHYDLAQTKSDALWLSSELDVDALEALRIVLLEWQNRPYSHLQAGYSEAEIASLRGVYGSNLAFDAEFQAATFMLRSEDEFNTETARRRRQVFTYFQECLGLSQSWLALLDERLSVLIQAASVRIVQPNVTASFEQCVDMVKSRVDALVNGPQWTVIDDDTNYIWQIGHLYHIASLMELLIVACRSTQDIPPTIIKKWVQAMATVGFFGDLEPSPLLPPEQVHRIQLLVALTSVAVIDPAGTIAQLDSPSQSPSFWLHNTDTVVELQTILYNATGQSCVQALPAALAWALILQKTRGKADEFKDPRDSPVSHRAVEGAATYDTVTGRRASLSAPTQQSIFEEVVDAVLMSGLDDHDPIGTLLTHTLELSNVSDILAAMSGNLGPDLTWPVPAFRTQILQEMVAAILAVFPDRYGPEILIPQFAILAPRRQLAPHQSNESSLACTTFLNDPFLVENILDVAAARFPHEALPFLKLCRLLSRADAFDGATQYITFRLKSLSSFTHAADGPFSDNYHTTREDENLNMVELEQNAYAFPQAAGHLLTQGGHNGPLTMVLPAGTTGEVISDSDVPIIRWQYRYSGLTMVGEWLEMHYNGVLHEVLAEHESPVDVVAEIIMLLAELLVATNSINDATNASREAAIDTIFEETSANISFGSNVTSLVFNILEQELQIYRRRPSSTMDTSILCASMSFAIALLNVRPSQFWSHVMKTSIVNSHGGGSLLYALTNGAEGVSGAAPVTEKTTELYVEMVNAAIRRPVDIARISRVSSRSSLNLLNNSSKMFEDALYGVTYTMLEMFDAMPTWKELPTQQEDSIVKNLTEAFQTLLHFRYGVGKEQSTLTACYYRAAELIMTRLRPQSADDAKSGAVLQHVLPAAKVGETFAHSRSTSLRLCSLFALSTTVMAVVKLEMLPMSGLEPCLLDIAPILIRQLPLVHRGQHPAARLLCSLLQSISSQKPASLLGHLGSTTSISLLNLLAAASLSRNASLAATAWEFLTQLISRDQQWLSMVILTGSVPEKQSRSCKEDSSVYRGRLFVTSAMTNIAQRDFWEHKTSRRERDLACSILHFLIAAQQNWSWTLSSVTTTANTFKALIDYITRANPNGPEAICHHNQISALAVDLGSVALQHAKAVRDISLMKVFQPLVKWLTNHAVDVSSFNSSLHSNLHKNFASKFGYNIQNFRRTELSYAEKEGYYDIDLANTVLSNNPAWKLDGRHADQSYFAEMTRANENLNMVESELLLLRSFQSLCMEHAAFFVQDPAIRVTMAHIIQRCLTANTTPYPAEQIFDNLFQSRAEIALALTQRLVKVNAHGSDFRNLLVPAWQCALYRNANYEAAITHDDLHYWRTTLYVVLLALQFHIGSGWKPLASVSSTPGELMKHTEHVMPEIIDVISVVVGNGLPSVVTAILEQKQAEMQQRPTKDSIDIGLKDITLILNTVETILRMSRLPEFATQISERILSAGTLQYVTRLYLFSHLLTSKETENEPVYAVLAARLVVSFSALQQVAENMAVEGVMSQVLTARVTQAIQRMPDGVGHLDQRAHCSVLYTIWSEGILALALNLLHAVRAPIATEISTFINTFPEQLRRVSEAFKAKPDEFVTLALAKEVATLSLISFMLDDYRQAGASLGVDPMMVLSLTGFDEHKKSLLEDLKELIGLKKDVFKAKIVPTNEKELGWHRGEGLVDKVLVELKSAVSCLEADDAVEGDKSLS